MAVVRAEACGCCPEPSGPPSLNQASYTFDARQEDEAVAALADGEIVVAQWAPTLTAFVARVGALMSISGGFVSRTLGLSAEARFRLRRSNTPGLADGPVVISLDFQPPAGIPGGSTAFPFGAAALASAPFSGTQSLVVSLEVLQGDPVTLHALSFEFAGP